MKSILIKLTCRRTITSLFAIVCLTFLGVKNTTDVSMAIASIAIGLSAANAAEKKKSPTIDQG